MRLTLEKRRHDTVELGIVYGVIALLALAAARYLPVLDVMPSCVFRQYTGLPCPSCGGTHSLVSLAHGGLLDAFETNPGFAVVFCSVLLFLVYDCLVLATGVRLSLSFSRRESSFGKAGILTALLANWAYLIIRFS